MIHEVVVVVLENLPSPEIGELWNRWGSTTRFGSVADMLVALRGRQGLGELPWVIFLVGRELNAEALDLLEQVRTDFPLQLVPIVAILLDGSPQVREVTRNAGLASAVFLENRSIDDVLEGTANYWLNINLPAHLGASVGSS